MPVSIMADWLGQVVGWALLSLYRVEDYHDVLMSVEPHEYFLHIYLPVGLTVGIGQYLLLRRSVRNGALWIGASIAGYAFGCITAAHLVQSFFLNTTTFLGGIILEISAEGAAGLVRGGVTALPLVYWFYSRWDQIGGDLDHRAIGRERL